MERLSALGWVPFLMQWGVVMIQNGEKQRELTFLCIKMAMKATIFFLGSSSSEIMMHMGF